MKREEFEQAKREFAEKYNPLFGSRLDEIREKTKSEFLFDLTALLEQHKEMMLREELIKYNHYLYEHHYTDSDIWADEPNPADEYLKTINE